jgi:effector-binding domain-containing protein
MSKMTPPAIVKRRATPYVAIPREAVIPFGSVISKTLPKVDRWLGKNEIEHGPAFFRYNRIKMPELGMEFGFLLPKKHYGEGEIIAGTLPAGRYATTTHWGHYRNLMNVTATLIGWARQCGHEFEMTVGRDGEHFASRFELYENGPADEPDSEKWETSIFIKVRN